jgi:hypothetical protein
MKMEPRVINKKQINRRLQSQNGCYPPLTVAS